MNELNASPDQEPKVIEAFISAAISTLQELAQFHAIADEMPVLDAFEKHNLVSATIRLLRRLPGTLTLLLTEESASRLAARYLPQGTALTDAIIDDVVGEIANVFAGQAKTILKGTPYHFTLSTPTVTRVPFLSQVGGDVEKPRMASVAFDTERLILLVQLPRCAGA